MNPKYTFPGYGTFTDQMVSTQSWNHTQLERRLTHAFILETNIMVDNFLT